MPTTTAPLTALQNANLEALARSCQDRHLTPTQRHDLHELMADVVDNGVRPSCCPTARRP